MNEQFDHIVSVGMFEHVGRKNHRIYMETAHRCLKDDGLFLLHTIGKNRRNSTPDPWIDRVSIVDAKSSLIEGKTSDVATIDPESGTAPPCRRAG